MKKILLGIIILSFVSACTSDKDSTNSPVIKEEVIVDVPAFIADSAYQYIEDQLAFGPRNPGSEGHLKCKNWLVNKLGEYCQVEVQSFNTELYTGENIIGYNIIGKFNPTYKKRIILAAHWDTRFMGEEDSDSEKRDQPIPGADDGGSGVGILLEIARMLKQNNINLGVDIILFDAEDQGKRADTQNEHTWCLGAQYWSLNHHDPNYRAKFGILLDMVGSKDATFAIEHFPGQVYDEFIQKEVVNLYNKTWKLANKLGHNKYFTYNRINGALTDDHYYVNRIAKIPMIDIINRQKSSTGFGQHWHTHDDDIDIISTETLSVVGKVVSEIIYREAAGTF